MFKQKINDLRNSKNDEFSHLSNEIFLDHAANALYMKSLIHDYYSQLTSLTTSSHLTTKLFSNPHSQSESGQYTGHLVQLTRENILSLFNTNLNEYDVVFVSNATQACKLIAESFHFTNKSVFAYLNDNHTSIIGMREVIARYYEAYIYCLYENNNEFDAKLVKKGFESMSESNIFNLIAYPAQSNFNGRKYDLDLIEKIHENRLLKELFAKHSQSFVLLDAASYVSTSSLDLSQLKPDFVPISFYKLFGFPTGIGALLVRKTPQMKQALSNKSFFGGGTVSMVLIDELEFKFKEGENFSFHEYLEDGTLSYLDIIGVNTAIEKFKNLFGHHFIAQINEHVQELSNYCVENLERLVHSNKAHLVEIYRHTSKHKYGPIVAFNLKNSQNKYIGFNLVDKLAQQYKIHLRVGCFCNIGACRMFLSHLNDNLKFKENFTLHGHKCGDHIDLINGLPTGAIRISFGYCSIKEDVDVLLDFLKNNFIDMGYENEVVRVNLPHNEQYFNLIKFFIYPIKSCSSIEINNSWPLCKNGFVYDRRWIIIDSNQIPLTQKKVPNLVNIKPKIDLKNNLLRLSIDEKSFEMSLEPNKDEKHLVNVSSHKIFGHDCGDEVGKWLKEALNIDCRLVQVVPLEDKTNETCVNASRKDNFKNQGDFLMISLNSIHHLRDFLLGELKSTLEEKDLLEFDRYLINQFRANILIDIINDDQRRIFHEETWSHLKILNTNIEFIKTDRCSRCQMINLSQSELSKLNFKTNLDLNKLLLKLYNLKSNSKFGIYLSLNNKTNKSYTIATTQDQITTNDNNDSYEIEKYTKLKCGAVGVATATTTTLTS